ncbi:MAG: L-threonylcarbamoyladenylate synthase [Bacteroidales bacterium]
MMNYTQKKDIENAVLVLEKGGVILYPTDTVWGIGCDATNAQAVEKVFKIKGREKNKSLIVLMSNLGQLKKYVRNIPIIANELIADSKRPTTIIYSEAINLAENAIAADGSIAIRIPDNEFCIQLIEAFGKPIVSTSANFSGEALSEHFNEIPPALMLQMDYIVQFNQDQINNHLPSRIIKLETNGSFVIIRE